MKPRLLFITPIVPALAGHGPAMRAGIVSEALAQRFRVYVLVVPLMRRVVLPAGDWCEQVRTLATTQKGSGVFRHTHAEAVECAAQLYQDVPFDQVHVFRLYLAPFAETYLKAGIPCSLDLDDVDSICFPRIASIYPDQAKRLLRDAERFVGEEDRWIPRFDRVFVASEPDRQLPEHAKVEVLPNAVRIPPTVATRAPGGVFTFLFLGTLGYRPNEDAVLFFCQRALPLLRQSLPKRCQFVVAGRSPSERVLALDSEPDIRVLGDVPDVSACYGLADAAVVPIRAGGGTRIKILEAAAYRCPVVSTSLGAEGLNVSHGRELLIGDSPADFARRCQKLMEDTRLRERMIERALAWVRREHTLDSVRKALDAAY